ncbi:LOW QUALITY PROTEIN: uncharacterized protein ACIBXB_021952 [Morphnus guianensis]
MSTPFFQVFVHVIPAPQLHLWPQDVGQGVKGKENLRTKKPFILMLNDQTSLDIMVMLEVLPSRCVPIAKKEILYMGTFGVACWLSGLIFIDHKKKEESITTLLEVAHSLHKENVSGQDSGEEPLEPRCGWKGIFGLGTEQNRVRASLVCSVCCVSIKCLKWRKMMSLHDQEQTEQSQGSMPVQWLRIVTGGPSISVSSPSCSSALIFPEGTCSHGSSMLPFKHGAFQLAVKAQVPIIPVVISSYCDFHNQKEKRFRPGEDDLGQRTVIPSQADTWKRELVQMLNIALSVSTNLSSAGTILSLLATHKSLLVLEVFPTVGVDRSMSRDISPALLACFLPITSLLSWATKTEHCSGKSETNDVSSLLEKEPQLTFPVSSHFSHLQVLPGLILKRCYTWRRFLHIEQAGPQVRTVHHVHSGFGHADELLENPTLCLPSYHLTLPGKSIIHILPEVETLGLAPDDVPKLTEQVCDSMLTAYQGISGMTNGTSH